MTFGYTIFYVADVQKTLEFYALAFGFKQKMLHESGLYGELETGATTLAFTSDELAKTNFSHGYLPNRLGNTSAGMEIGFVTTDVKTAFQVAVAAGAIILLEPTSKPWGQIVGYVQDNNGIIVEICSPI